MSILSRHTIRELMLPFALTLALFTVVFLTGSLVKMADTVLNKGVSLFDVFKILALMFPEVFSFTLPTSALAAAILTLGGFAQNNELRAMKATGINLVHIMVPVLAIAAIVSFLSLIFNDQVVTEASFAKRKLVKRILFKKPTAFFEPNKFVKEFEDYIFHVKGVNGNKLDQVIIYQPQENKPTRMIYAERGEVSTSPDGSELTITLYNGTIDEGENDELYKLDFETYAMPPISVESAATLRKKTREMQLSELIQSLREGKEREINVEDGLRNRAELQKRLAFSLATFMFVMIGLPLAVLVNRGEFIWSFSISMCVVIVYYVLYIWAGTVANHGFLPPEIALWLPNILLFVIGAWLIRKAVDA